MDTVASHIGQRGAAKSRHYAKTLLGEMLLLMVTLAPPHWDRSMGWPTMTVVILS
jgi:hypothetical protein